MYSVKKIIKVRNYTKLTRIFNFNILLLVKSIPKVIKNSICIPESFNTNISHQVFDYKITFVNSQYENSNSKVILYSKAGFKRSFSRFRLNKNKSESKIYIICIYNWLTTILMNIFCYQAGLQYCTDIWITITK